MQKNTKPWFYIRWDTSEEIVRQNVTRVRSFFQWGHTDVHTRTLFYRTLHDILHPSRSCMKELRVAPLAATILVTPENDKKLTTDKIREKVTPFMSIEQRRGSLSLSSSSRRKAYELFERREISEVEIFRATEQPYGHLQSQNAGTTGDGIH